MTGTEKTEFAVKYRELRSTEEKPNACAVRVFYIPLRPDEALLHRSFEKMWDQARLKAVQRRLGLTAKDLLIPPDIPEDLRDTYKRARLVYWEMKVDKLNDTSLQSLGSKPEPKFSFSELRSLPVHVYGLVSAEFRKTGTLVGSIRERLVRH